MFSIEKFRTLMKTQRFRKAIVVIVFILIITMMISLFIQAQQAKRMLANPEEASQKQIQETVERVSLLMALPKDEEPSVATVSDVEKLKDQTFFANAKNGDKVLIFESTGRAILYRPSEHKIIEVAPIDKPNGAPAGANQQPAQNTTKEVSFESTTVSIYNATKVAGLAQKTADKIKSKYPRATIVSLENAAKTDYESTLIIDIGGKPEQAAALVTLLNGKLTELPDGELHPTADVLVIVAE